MSIMGMQRKFKKHVRTYKAVWAGIFLIFLVGSVQNFSPRNQSRASMTPPPDPIASVNGTPISRKAFNNSVTSMLRRFGRNDLDPMLAPFVKESAFNGDESSVVVATLLEQEADRANIDVSNDDVQKHINSIVDMSVLQLQMRFPNKKRFEREMEANGGLEKYKEEIRNGIPWDLAQHSVRMEKFAKSIRDEAKVTRKEYEDSLRKVLVRQILIKTKPLDPKSKGKTPSNPDSEARQEATLLLKEIRNESNTNPGKFEFIASQRNDEVVFDPKGKSTPASLKGGLIGWVGIGEKKAQYGDDYDQTIFKLKPGEIADHVIKGPDGYRIVKVEEAKIDYPKDYNAIRYECKGKLKGKDCNNIWQSDKKADKCPKCGSTKIESTKMKDTFFENFKRMKQDDHWRSYIEKLKTSAKIELYDPELQAYELETQSDPQKLKEAIGYFEDALKYAQSSDRLVQPVTIYRHLSNIYGRLGEKDKQIETLQKALESRSDVNWKIEVANLLVDQWAGQHGEKSKETRSDAQKARKDAIAQLREASEMVVGEPTLHTSIASAYRKLGMEKEAAMEQEKAKVKPTPPPVSKFTPSSAESKSGHDHDH